MKTLINALITVFPMIFNIQYLHCGCCKGSKGSKTKSTKATEQLAGFKDFTAENLAQDIGVFFNYTNGSSANVFVKVICEKVNKFIEDYTDDDEAEISGITGDETTWKEGGRPLMILYKDKKYKYFTKKIDISTIKKFFTNKEIIITFGIAKYNTKPVNYVSYTIKSENILKLLK